MGALSRDQSFTALGTFLWPSGGYRGPLGTPSQEVLGERHEGAPQEVVKLMSREPSPDLPFSVSALLRPSWSPLRPSETAPRGPGEAPEDIASLVMREGARVT